MATPRKTAVDPLKEELPPAPEPKPQKAQDVSFEVQIQPYIVQGKTYFRWEILDHNHKGYAGDYSGHRDSGFHDPDSAVADAEAYVARIREAVHLKLNAPQSFTVIL